ncbi:MAG TPA: RNA polymerase sigma factor [Terriglobales bacterium]|nr:RNA polymerase sigma factor [Terriglobales bacterium]
MTEQTALSDEQIVARVLAGERELFEILMRRHNQRIYRAARAILRDDTESEDVMQEAYIRAFTCLRQFEGRASFSSWLTRIAVNEALRRRRRGRVFVDHVTRDEEGREQDRLGQAASAAPGPEEQVSTHEMTDMLENAILSLPEQYRAVLVLRDIEELSTAEVAECLGITEGNAKVRLHRAHALLRRALYARSGQRLNQAFQFHAPRCDRVVHAVMERITAI